MDKRLLKKPKYKIGDVVVYKSRVEEDGTECLVFQSKIVEAFGTIDLDSKVARLDWCYHTKQTNEESDDYLEEDYILYKI